MKRPVRYGGQPVSRAVSIPSPTGGWDSSTNITSVPADRAIELVNVFPNEEDASLRRGFVTHATGMVGPVETLMPFASASSQQLFAACNGGIYDVTSAGPVGAPGVTGLSSNRWQYANFATSGGQYLWVCNGADDPRHYNGSSWVTPTLTGVTGAAIRSVFVFQRRLFFVLNSSAKFGYLPVEQIAGAVSTFDLGPLFSQGGRLQAITGFSRDAGDGPDDFIAFISSRGETLVYRGTDPSSSTTWALVGKFLLAEPIGDRCVSRFSGDALILTKVGIVSMLQSTQADETQWRAIILNKTISSDYVTRARAGSSNFGWSITRYAAGKMIIVNTPVTENLKQEQYALNAVSGAACLFRGMNANCWEVHNEDLYFGGNGGVVYRADVGTTDNGSAIRFTWRTAFSDLGVNTIKKINDVRVFIKSSSVVRPGVGIDVDFNARTPQNAIYVSEDVPPRLGAVTIGNFRFAASSSTVSTWLGAGNAGRFASLHVDGLHDGELTFMGAAALVETGNVP